MNPMRQRGRQVRSEVTPTPVTDQADVEVRLTTLASGQQRLELVDTRPDGAVEMLSLPTEDGCALAIRMLRTAGIWMPTPADSPE